MGIGAVDAHEVRIAKKTMLSFFDIGNWFRCLYPTGEKSFGIEVGSQPFGCSDNSRLVKSVGQSWLVIPFDVDSQSLRCLKSLDQITQMIDLNPLCLKPVGY